MSKKSEYVMVSADGGTWLHAPGSDFLFAFLLDDWDNQTKSDVKNRL